MNSKNDINASVLGYNPDLTISARPYSGIEAEQAPAYIDNYNPNKSAVVDEFELHKPSSKIQNLINTKNSINEFKKQMKEDLVGHELSDRYFSSEYEEEIKEIEDLNRLDPENGSTKLEAYIEIEKLDKEIGEVLDSFMISIYGKDVDDVGASEIDEAYIEKLNSLEAIGEFEKINYFSLYYDTQISFLMGEYADRVLEVAVDLSILEDRKANMEMNESNVRMIKTSFAKTNKIFEQDLHKDECSCKEILISMHNVFLAKQDFNMYLDTFSSLFSLGEEYETINEIKAMNMEELDIKLDNLVKSIMYSPISKNDIVDSLGKKSRFRGFFAN